MKRRSFIKSSGALTVGSVLLNGISVKGTPLPPPFTCQQIQDRIFVMINLFGANDTLNTVVPMQQYSIYANARPTIRIMDAGANKYLELDSTLPTNQQTALHPIMTPFKALYDEGKLNVVHGVGYLNNNRSHFKSDDLWNTAGDTTPANFNHLSGWAGELFEYRYPGILGSPNAAMPDPPCIEMGATAGSILFQTANNNNASVLLTNSNIATYYNTLIAVGGPAPATLPPGDFGADLTFIDDVQRLSNIYAQRIQSVFNAGNNSAGVTYPNTSIANQLKTVARLIKGGSKSNMYTVHQYGFDTHGNQIINGSSHTGLHSNLLRDLTMGIKAFMDDIAALGFEDRVVITTHSEFGRTIDENSGLGTDHGGVSTMFVIGKGVKPGITGTPIDLTKVTTRALTDLQFDYRAVWAAVLQDFMGHGPQPMTAARMNDFTTTKPAIISEEYKATPACYINYIVLPVTIASFNVRLLASGNAELVWETSSETNCKEFDVQHSIDNLNWTSIGTVAGNGNSSMLSRYSLQHSKPSVGINYYRLWQVDYNGSRRIFGPKILRVKKQQGFEVKIYPNPAVYDFNIAITAEKKQNAVINIYDIQGHLLNSRNAAIPVGFTKINIPVNQLRNYKGEIIVQIKTDYGFEQASKLIIQ
ncbi:MAG TPA: DUF1501 domain-containing protein [Ferruginibacter sp.]|nr:DUF1501 domain-containing protein [Ferruginibacter sp.]HRE63981.1 DUF1501 domain-containing protein [Ferruginibacter sp.]